ncbi:hypothetical protein CDO73_00865 [Saccharibacillus sp. O23]|uniref:hypothetical protein n=1 Tax=Saccharibacillus sp. O23 TaxID=2009338 RepID=UPI000B4E233B|nr:hypothetical protein [Saccharibacillus sp. O23]OWR33092.1 hypothetical protein CDO73_00865 [Saccharibacillus sp. O23]
MRFSEETKREMQRAFEECREAIRAYPAPYAQTGVRYLDRFDPQRGSGPTNYICCLLPYWLRQAAAASLETCRRIAEANVFGMLHFHLLDEQTDRSDKPDRARIALSQLFNAEMNARYAEIFRSPKNFRTALLRCSAEWAAGIASERGTDPFFERPELIAARSAPLLLCPLALFENDDRMRARALHAVQEALITLQMADDWADYAEDLQEGSYNCLVSLHRRERALPLEAPLTSGDIDQAVYAGGMLGRYAEYASRRQTELESYRADFPGLIDFHAALAGDLERIASGIETEKQRLALGGLNYWLLGRDHPS